VSRDFWAAFGSKAAKTVVGAIVLGLHLLFLMVSAQRCADQTRLAGLLGFSIRQAALCAKQGVRSARGYSALCEELLASVAVRGFCMSDGAFIEQMSL